MTASQGPNKLDSLIDIMHEPNPIFALEGVHLTFLKGNAVS